MGEHRPDLPVVRMYRFTTGGTDLLRLILQPHDAVQLLDDLREALRDAPPGEPVQVVWGGRMTEHLPATGPIPPEDVLREE